MIEALTKWLRAREQEYGGLVRVPRQKVSPHDPRTPAELARGSMIGGDQMTRHGYAPHYAAGILSFLSGGNMQKISADVLRDLEIKYSGGVIERKIPWPNVSPNDPRPQKEIDRGAHDGHRMQPRDPRGPSYGRDYAAGYADALAPVAGEGLTIVELGILRGIGLAIWCDLFPDARIIGLDIDRDIFNRHLDTLVARGAFKRNAPEIHTFDELAPDAGKALAKVLGGDMIDIMIDDALHDNKSILKAMGDFMPYMAPYFIYFVEDNPRVHVEIMRKYPVLTVKPLRELTVIRR
jgi:hypothetical protein